MGMSTIGDVKGKARSARRRFFGRQATRRRSYA
jgi:hypothetical protein